MVEQIKLNKQIADRLADDRKLVGLVIGQEIREGEVMYLADRIRKLVCGLQEQFGSAFDIENSEIDRQILRSIIKIENEQILRKIETQELSYEQEDFLLDEAIETERENRLDEIKKDLGMDFIEEMDNGEAV